MTNKEIIEALLTTDLRQFQNVQDLYDMARAEKDYELVKKVRELSYQGAFGAEHQKDFYDLNMKTYLYGAQDYFEDYLIFLEWNREPKEKFYVPRRRIMNRVAEQLQRLEDDELDELFLQEPPRVGKLVKNSTKVLTPSGWKNHGDLVVGDKVVAPSGKFVKVLAVHPKHHTTHVVEFTNGEKIECHENHEWVVYDRRKKCFKLLETKEMIGKVDKGEPNKRGHRYMYLLPNKAPLDCADKDLPVAPYSLGAWLGDGTNTKPLMSNDQKDIAIIERMVEDGYSISSSYIQKETGVLYNHFDGLRTHLQKIGMCYSRKTVEKFIPQEYLTASLRQRLELLAGLIDTDGCLIKKERRYQFSTTSEKLKDGFVSLISTFGWRTSIKTETPKKSSSNIQGKKMVWTIGFNPTFEIPCVLKRKQLKEFNKQRRIAIKSITECKPQEGNCITVEGGVYCVGETLIPTHNSTMIMFFLTWIMGKHPESSNLYVAFSDTITRALYNGVMEVITDPVTYNWSKVFPTATIADTNSKDETVNISRKKRYPTLTARSLYGTLNGACDCNGYLISDDLLSGIEEAMNPVRLDTAWNHVDNNMVTRAKAGAKKLWCGTMWSIADPISRRKDFLEAEGSKYNIRYYFLNLPALNEQDESNFDYDFGVGFDTNYYRQRRASFEKNNDMASWLAQYQQSPIERQGTLFEPAFMRYYNGVLPEGEPDRIFMACDIAWGGGDFLSAPICYQYGDDVYVHDVVYNNGDKYVTRPIVIDKILKHKVNAAQFEANNGGSEYCEHVTNELKGKGYRLNIRAVPAPTNKKKEQRIFDKAPEIREMYFLDTEHRDKEYTKFMQNVFSFTVSGKNKSDDAPDSLAMAIDVLNKSFYKPQTFKRPF